ncbi:MAG TPA: biotin--[acetyl-CoA-carboxylase] ligase [Caulobacteraceae bacterium]|jgi:BirA family biotin operon repressor/biotin-[acetyl-CoA-carboxylase] ligase|nr:biotin--[acetyl-CoA-carboxylase] ligase [Caulobacteraceae bacterium]
MTDPVLWLDTVDSTNAEARRRAEAGEEGPLWIAAERQTAGRGRRGREWRTPGGGLAATFLTCSPLTAAEAAGVSFVAAMAVSDLAGAYVPEVLVSLKWPNDVLVDGEKLAGILVETGPAPRGGVWLAVGIGVNLSAVPPDVERPATALSRHLALGCDTPTPRQALAVLAKSFDCWRQLWEKAGLPLILDAWSGRSVGIPGPCTARLADETLEGTAEGLDSEGRLRLRLADGDLRRIAAGDVFFGKA